MVCRTVTQVQGVCLTGLVGGLWRPDAGLVEMKSGGFVDDVDRMGKWPGYGGYAVAMGEWPAYGDLVWRMGRCVRRVVVWERRETYEEMACVEGRRIAWGAAKTYGDPGRMGICGAWATVYGLRDVGLRTLQFFVNCRKATDAYGGRLRRPTTNPRWSRRLWG